MITGTTESSELEVEVISNGAFYYNWSSAEDRGTSAMLMRDLDTGEVTRDVNLDGTFYFINTTDGSCFHFKIPGVNGPAAPTWVKKSFKLNGTDYLAKLDGSPDAHWEAA